MRRWLCLLVLLLLPLCAHAVPDTPYDPALMVYYPRLTQPQQSIFDRAYTAAMQGEFRVELEEHPAYDDACAAMDALLMDCPELCALSGAYRVGYYQNKPQEAIYIELSYTMPVSAQRDTVQAAGHMAEKALGDELQREWILHDLLCQKTVYDAEGPNAHNAYGALVEGRAVCDGYAKAMALLLRLTGLESGVAQGKIKATGGAHAWNLVKVDGAYTWLDVTNDDQSAVTTYFFFNLTDEWMERSYILETQGLPPCEDFSVNWHKYNWRYVSAEDDLQKHIMNNFRNMAGHGSRFCLRFEREADYRSLREGVYRWAIQYNKLGEYALEGSMQTYYSDEQQCVIVEIQ